GSNVFTKNSGNFFNKFQRIDKVIFGSCLAKRHTYYQPSPCIRMYACYPRIIKYHSLRNILNFCFQQIAANYKWIVNFLLTINITGEAKYHGLNFLQPFSFIRQKHFIYPYGEIMLLRLKHSFQGLRIISIYVVYPFKMWQYSG